ncbi:hypothetical protein BCR44DRAFT_1175778, partial [Catenaria anguillulae PL171]
VNPCVRTNIERPPHVPDLDCLLEVTARQIPKISSIPPFPNSKILSPHFALILVSTMAPVTIASSTSVSVATYADHMNQYQSGVNDQPNYLQYVSPTIPTPTMDMDKRHYFLKTCRAHWLTKRQLTLIPFHGFHVAGTSHVEVAAMREAEYEAYRASVAATTDAPLAPVPAPTAPTSPMFDTASIVSDSSDATLVNYSEPTDAQPSAIEAPSCHEPPAKEEEEVPAGRESDQEEPQILLPVDKCALPSLAKGGPVFQLPSRLADELVRARQHALQRQKRRSEGMGGKVKRFFSRLLAVHCQ